MMHDEPNHSAAYAQLAGHLIGRARKASAKAQSYREFRVGCAVLGYLNVRYADLSPYKIFSGHNTKLVSDGPKTCAEQVALSAAIDAQCEVIVAICVVGQPQEDNKSGVRPKTLHCCADCRELLRRLPQVTGETIMLFANNHKGPWEEMTVEQLLRLHAENKICTE